MNNRLFSSQILQVPLGQQSPMALSSILKSASHTVTLHKDMPRIPNVTGDRIT